MKRAILALLAVFLGLGFMSMSYAADNEARLLRFPDINGNLIVFVYAGDIWSVPATGGEARRLTSDIGLELFPKISPDGKWIAFSAEYSGTRQVYIMPSGGGVPVQLTYYNDVGIMPPRAGWDYQVCDWSPDSKKILVRANRTPWGERMGKYFLVSVDGGLETPLQIPEAGGGTFCPCGTKIVYTPISREFRTWKRYKGGRAQDIWIYDLVKNVSKRITTFPGTDQHPIKYKEKIYFASDRDLTLNIYAYDSTNEQVEKITNHTDYDVLWPSGKNGDIVYECGGYIWKLDLATREEKKVPVAIHFDNPNLLASIKNVRGNIDSFDISPTGKRAVFEARGEIFTVPAKEGVIYNLTDSQGVREIYPRWSPDGKYVAYYSDVSGEYEIYLMETTKSSGNKITQLTTGSKIWRFPPAWSPDSTKLLLGDKDLNLQILDVATKKVTLVDRARSFDLTDYGWSPDSKWVVYGKDGESGQNAIWVYSLDQAKAFQLTDSLHSDFSPVFSPCGKYIYFLSDRTFNLSFSSFESYYVYNRSTKIYAMTLTKTGGPLFKDKNDVEEIKKAETPPAKGAKDDKAKPEPKTKAEEKPAATVQIDFDGINDRIAAFPLEAGSYQALGAIEGGVIYGKDGDIHKFTIEDKKDATIISGISGATLSADVKKLLYRSGDRFGIVELSPGQKVGDGELNLADLNVRIDPQKEWQQIYNDGWRIVRDWFYVKNMHGVDWAKMREKYGLLVPYVSHRADLDFIFGELVAELNVGHAYVDWGDFPHPKRLEGGLLGCTFRADEKAGRYVISKIYKGENWDESSRSPLTEQGVGVREGDYLISLNGHDVTLKDNPYKYLENTAGKKVDLFVNAKPTAEGAREYWVKPIKNELRLFYLDWVRTRRELVDKLSGGRIGYIHVPDTNIAGNRELFKGFYAYHKKDALIIDERYNGGGFIPDVMTDLLGRRMLNYIARTGLEMASTPQMVHEGPKVMLINGYAGSGGDAFPYYFRKRKLGTLIGTRTWGGLVGLSGNPGLVDGGSINVPTFAFVSTEGEWAVEGVGVSPDIEVWDLPELVAAGKDPSVEKGVEVLMEELKKNPPKKVQKPMEPDRSKWVEKDIK